MSQEIRESEEDERNVLPIERGFPIERVNEIAEKENRAKQHYRPIYTMHKWWARRLGSVFRTICLYTLIEEDTGVTVSDSERVNQSLNNFVDSESDVQTLIGGIDLSDPDDLWPLYTRDVRVDDKKVLDPFMGGGTSIVEASRFGASVDGRDLNPVAWFVSKKEIDAGETGLDTLDDSFDSVKKSVADDIKHYYQTPCPNQPDDHMSDVMHYFWVKELDCVSCGHEVSLFKDYRVGKGRYEHSGEYHVLCPECELIVLVDDWRSESTCPECSHEFVPEDGTAGRGDYICPECGQKYGILDAVQEQDGFSLRMYALEYYCPTCEKEDYEKGEVKGYRSISEYDINLLEEARSDWKENNELRDYIPNEEIPLGIKTDSSKIDGSITGGHNVLRHGFSDWSDMYNDRQLLALATILREIEQIEDDNSREFLLLAFSECLKFNTIMVPYQAGRNHIQNIFKSNSFDPPQKPAENNVWGTDYGMGSFIKTWNLVRKGVEYANSPTERYIENGETKETDPFETSIGGDTSVELGDVRDINQENEYDAIITDPPYYDNVIYSELSDYFYVWLKIILNDYYDGFDDEMTPRSESIVANPAAGKGAEEFESEIKQAFSRLKRSLKKDGVLVFTYHHSESESWGELLEALCEVGFEVTATYPISADTHKFFEGEAVSFDIVVVARPSLDRESISWNSLRRQIYRTAKKTRQQLEENRDLSRGDIGVVEMGRCFHEYSKHHGKVERAGETMTAKEVVDEIYGVIQHGSDIGEIDVFLDLLETPDASYDDLNKLCRGTNATPERMEDMRLYRMDDGFKLGTWDDEKRIAYIQSRVENNEELTHLDKAQFLRYRWEHGKSVSEYLGRWDITDDLRELCEGLADATGDDTYRNILESRLSDY